MLLCPIQTPYLRKHSEMKTIYSRQCLSKIAQLKISFRTQRKGTIISKNRTSWEKRASTRRHQLCLITYKLPKKVQRSFIFKLFSLHHSRWAQNVHVQKVSVLNFTVNALQKGYTADLNVAALAVATLKNIQIWLSKVSLIFWKGTQWPFNRSW